mmetsp:Transcript_14580/g.43533  ORF Transcript_14580/g.43533 Transcript_14580/m.43533 type:complete len:240 (-) Transcript_14580:326-1045(-)
MFCASILVASSSAASTAPRGTALPSTSKAHGGVICNAARRALHACSSTPSGRSVPAWTTPVKTSASAKAPTAVSLGEPLDVGACTMILAAIWLAMYSTPSSLRANTPSVETSKRARKTDTQRVTLGAASTWRRRQHCSLITSSLATALPPKLPLRAEAEWIKLARSLRNCGCGPAPPSSASATLQMAAARARSASGVVFARAPAVSLASTAAGCGPVRSTIRAASNQHCSRALTWCNRL